MVKASLTSYTGWCSRCMVYTDRSQGATA